MRAEEEEEEEEEEEGGKGNIISANCCERQKGKKENGVFCFGSKRTVDGLIIAGKCCDFMRELGVMILRYFPEMVGRAPKIEISRCTASDLVLRPRESRENPFLQKSPYPVLYENKLPPLAVPRKTSLHTVRKWERPRFSFRWLLNQSMAAAPNPLR